MIFLTLCIAFIHLKAQSSEPKVDIQLLGPDQGLPDRTVRCIVQDSQGFLWIGTGAALWRYDGYSFYNYTYLLTSSNGTITLIDDLKLGPDGRIWVAHSNGLTLINPVTLQSVSPDVNSLLPGKSFSRQAVKIHFDNDGAAWVSMVGNGLIKLDKDAKPLLVYRAPHRQKDESMATGAVFKILEDSTGKLYLFSLDHYLEVIDKTGKYLRGIELAERIVPKGFSVANISLSQRQSLLVYYVMANQRKESLIREYSFAKAAFVPLSGNTNYRYPADTYADQRGLIWYKGEKEIGFLNTHTGKFTSLTEQIQEKVGAETYLFTGCLSSDNTLWLCSGAGLFKITVSEPLFQNYLSIPLQKPADVGTSMRGITEDSIGNLWLCSYGFKKNDTTYLAHKLYPQTGVIQHLQVRIANDTSLSAPTSAYILYKIFFNKNGMYAITDGTSLLKLKPDGTALKAKAYNGVSINEFTSSYTLNDSILWLGSISGMIKMNIQTGKSVLLNSRPENFIKNIRLNYFMPWSPGHILVSTSNGLYVLDSNALIVEHYGNNKEDKIQLPVQSVSYTTWHQQYLWAASPNGLLRIDTALKKTALFTTKEGLPDNNIYACLPDNQGNLWLSTNNGLCRFNMQTKKVHNYGLADGLPSMEFNTASYLKSSSGKLYFGGLNGIISFDPARLNSTKEEEVSLQLISYSKYAGSTNRLETIMRNQVQSPIIFSSGDRFFDFRFMAPDFRHTDQNRFRYKLEGWADKDWHLFETGNRLSFNSLPPGTYQLQVQVSVAGADWSSKTWQTTIKVLAPWYKTAWFYGLSLLVIALIFYAFYRYRLAQIIRIHQIRNRISADMHDEIGSTLSSITFYSQALLMQQQDEKQKEVLQKIKENAQQVQEGLSDIIWSVRASLDEIENVFARMFRFGSELLESKNIQFHFKQDEKLQHEKLNMTERKNFYLIFKEAINNAAKYAQCRNIWVQVSEEQHKIQMVIQDDGKGFDPLNTERGNGLSNMQERAAQINGKLTVQSSQEKGTTITLLF